MSRVAIVTGGTRGIGRAICERLRDERGFTIIANYAGNDDAARRFTEETGIATARFDVGDHDAVVDACKAIEAEHGAIDVVVNNAGITRDGTLLKMSYEDWDAVMRTNLQVNYAAAKSGIHGFTKALAQEGARFGITVNAIAPGYIDTDMVAAVPEPVLEKIVAKIPVGRLGKAGEIARGVSFLCSEHAEFVTGSTMSINGGQHMY